MKRRTARVVLVCFGLLLIGQFWIMLHSIEPYPAFCYPTFKYLTATQTEMDYSKPEFVAVFADGAKEQVNYFRLFEMVPVSHVNHLVSGTLSPGEQRRSLTKPFRKLRLGDNLIEIRRTELPPTAEDKHQLNEFFKRRIAAVTGRADAVRLEIAWIQHRFVYGRGEISDKGEIEKRREFDLESDLWR